jgi:hypothetical protein
MPKEKSKTDEQPEEKSPAELVASGVCPECGESLEGRDVAAHAGKHWRGQGAGAPQVGTPAYERQQALLGKED